MQNKIKIIFLGTNGWYDTKTGNTICTLIETDNEYIILDAGSGLYKAEKYITKDKPVYMFLSHFHLDHIYGLHVLAKFNFKQGLQIFGPPETKKILGSFIDFPYTMPINDLKMKVQIKEIDEEKPALNVEAAKLVHSSLCYGYRFNLNGKILTYCTDTGVCDNMLKLAQNADLLITECALKPGKQTDNWPHLNPEFAAKVALDAKAKRLALVHFDAEEYPTMKERKNAEKVARGIFKNTFAAQDDQAILL